jgi:hypothetical protein
LSISFFFDIYIYKYFLFLFYKVAIHDMTAFQ